MKFVIHPHKQPTREEKDAAFGETTVVRSHLGFLLSVLGVVIVATLGWAGMSQRVEAESDARKELARAHAETQDRVKILEHAQLDIAAMRTDVEWIKRTMQEDRARAAGK